MSRALWLLVWLQLVGWLRYLGRNLRTVRGALLGLVGAAVFLPWVFAMLFAPTTSGIELAQLRRFGPASLLLYCFMNVIFSPTDRAIYFTPAEIQFLFSGPFTRRQLLGYKVVLTLLVSLPTSLILVLVLRVRDGWTPAVMTGLLLASIFMQIFTLVLNLLASVLGQQMLRRGRFIALAILVLVGAVLFSGTWPTSVADLVLAGDRLTNSTAWHVLSWPMRSFTDAMTAQRFWPDLALSATVAVAINLVLVGVIFSLDAQYLEESAASSTRMYARMQRIRGRQVNVESDSGAAPPRFTVPSFPYLGGIGPIFWRQLTSMVRNLGRLTGVFIILFMALAFPLIVSRGSDKGEVLAPALVGMGAWMSIFLTTLVPFDFRGDIDRIAVLRTLPIAPWRLALGQLLAPVVLLTVLEWLLVAILALVWRGRLAELLAAAAYLPVVNFLVVALDNLLFLLFPTRIMAATPGDFQAMGHNVLLSLGKVVGIGVVVGLAAVIALATYYATHSMWMTVAAPLPFVGLAGLALVPLIALAFQKFDVGRDTPA